MILMQNSFVLHLTQGAVNMQISFKDAYFVWADDESFG